MHLFYVLLNKGVSVVHLMQFVKLFTSKTVSSGHFSHAWETKFQYGKSLGHIKHLKKLSGSTIEFLGHF